MPTSASGLLVVTLAESSDPGTWLAEYVGETPLHVIAARERSIEDDVRAGARGLARECIAAVAINHSFMGFLAKRAVDTLRELEIAMPALVHPTAHVPRTATLGEGVRIGAGAILGDSAVIADHARVLERAVVGRSCRIGTFTTVDAGALIGEGTAIGGHAWIRAGAIVEPRTQVEDACELQAGAAHGGVIPRGTVYLPGLDSPARILRFGG